MRHYRALTLLLVCIFIGGSLLNFIRQQTLDELATERQARSAVFPNADRFSDKTGSPSHFQAFSNESAARPGKPIGILYVTTDVTPEINGYAGPIKVMVGLMPNGDITGTKVIKHNETPAYVTGLTKFMQQFIGKSIKNPLQLDADLDGISRATVTSKAIVDAINQSGKQMGRKILKIDIEHGAVEKKTIRYELILMPLLLFTIAVIAVIRKNNYLRWTALMGGLLYFGIYQSTMVSIVQFINISLLKTPAFVDHPLWYALVGLTLISLLLIGNVYCGHLCPFAGLQELIYASTAKIRPKKSHISNQLVKQLRWGKYAVLFTVVLLSMWMGKSDPANIEVFVLLFSRHATWLGWGLVGLMLILSAVHYRFWCRYLCPMGALNGLLARFSFLKIGLDQNCGGCQACSKLCPTDAIDMQADRPVIDYAECILCGKCMQKCPKGSLHYKHPDTKKELNSAETG